jgi:hypothetical protein
MKGMSAVAIVMLGTAGTMELSVQAFAQAEPQPALLPQQATVQPTHRAQVLDALGKGDFASAEKFISDLQGQLQANSALATQSGSTVFEELKACGFYPQETRLACMIEIKQQLGYAGPVGAPGSMEHVYFCIDWDNNGIFTQLESAGQGTVQMHDEAHPTQAKPPWVYAIYRDFNPFGGSRTSNSGTSASTVSSAPTFRVKATLSWAVAPTGCNYIPVWGNSMVFQIRMDPIR